MPSKVPPSNKQNSDEVSRRKFVAAGSAVAAATSLTTGLHTSPASAALSSAQDRVVVGVMGLSRGMSLARTFSETPGVEIKYLCETDTNRLNAAKKSFEGLVDYGVQTTGDFRQILDDPDVDILICAAPNHWHAPAAIMACNAGKHCYVEKPCSHNPWEGEMAVAAARKHKRCVQMGNQRRSAEKIIEAMKLLHEGRIGRVYYSRSWYANSRGSIGTGTPAEVPPHIDYELWQGPAPRQPFTSNRLPYNWHWVWHYGNGELGNNGIHTLDLSRWGLQADYPTRVVSSGGRYRFDDDQQTADSHVVSFQFEGKRQIIWEGLSCSRLGLDGNGFGVTFHGEDGSVKLDGWGYSLHDSKGKEIERVAGARSDADHIANFVNAVRADDPTMLNAEIEEGHKSTLLCHLGNIAHRTGDTITCDPSNGHIVGNAAAEKLWKREYEPGWEPTI
ncbi:MAG: Gfo/Idh/MocA family oxidoreductase [Fuerstiella sp.]|nr:Gfo/Idh/MocA family oxidoreductase [Fuerstiella sp.]